jgi:hypothetical protein
VLSKSCTGTDLVLAQSDGQRLRVSRAPARSAPLYLLSSTFFLASVNLEPVRLASPHSWLESGDSSLIVIEPLGGLGNQLFTYSVGLANAKRLETELLVDLRNFKNYVWHRYELESFANSITGEITEDSVLRPAAHGMARFFRPREKPPESALLPIMLEQEETNLFSARFLELRDNSRLRGYFQSWKYLEPVATLLDQELWSLSNPSPWFIDKKEEMLNREPWIGFHFRLGDYQGLDEMGVVADIYYRRALGLLRDLGVDRQVVIFTDSPEVIKNRNFMAWGFSSELFESDPASTPLENMLLLSLSEHIVMANSTFSWWAAWLGRNNGSDRRVIYPRPWINLQSWDDRDLPSPEWIGLSRDVVNG